MSAQALHDLQALIDGRAEVRRARDRVALIEVVWPHSPHQQPVIERLQRVDGVVDVLEQQRLAAERNAGVCYTRSRLGHLGGGLSRMGGVKARSLQVVLIEDPAIG